MLIQAGSVAAALWVLWIGALSTVSGNAALWLAGYFPSELLYSFATWGRAFMKTSALPSVIAARPIALLPST